MLMASFVAFIVDFVSQDFLSQIPRETVLTLISFIVSLLVLTVIFYIAGAIVVGRQRARFSDAFVISLLGTIVDTICLVFFPQSLIGLFLSLVVWLLLIRRYYETGWLGALAVGILALIVSVVIRLVLSIILGISILLFGGSPFLIF